MFTGQLGGANSQLGQIVPGGIRTLPLPFGFTPHVLDAATIRVQFGDEVDESALSPSAYSMLAVSGPVPNFLPSVVSVAFYDADHRSVSLTLNQSLTFSAVYALSIVGVTSPDGNSVMPNAGNFRANVPDPPIVIGAFQSNRGMIDIYFDRAVGPTSPLASANIQASRGGNPESMTMIPWDGSFPANVLRFELNPAMDVASSYTVTYQNVTDASYNSGSGQVPLTLILRAPQPYSYSVLSTPQVIDAWVDSISNSPSGYQRALINVFFNCPMSHSDIETIANWSVTSNGTALPVLAVNDWSSRSGGRAFPSVDGHTYFAQVAVPATAATTPYNVQVQVRSEDLANTTNPANYTGSIAVQPLVSPPKPIGSLVVPSSANIRFSQGISLPNSIDLHPNSTSDQTHINNASVTSSLATLVLCITDLMSSYNQHITVPFGAVHITPDVTNYFLSTDFPSADLDSAITAVNRFRDVYLQHASSTVYHHFADPSLVTRPYATDLPSAVSLANDLVSSFIAHNANAGVHITAGVPLFSAKLFDILALTLGMQIGVVYQLSIKSQYYFIDVGHHSVPMKFGVSTAFTGSGKNPYVASAIPKPGLVDTNNGLRMEQDSVLVFFSKPIQVATLDSSNIIITGPTNIVTQGYEWVGNRVLNVGVINMSTAQYSLDILDVQDIFGNEIVSA